MDALPPLVTHDRRKEYWTASGEYSLVDAYSEAIKLAKERHGPVVLRFLHEKGAYRTVVRPTDNHYELHYRFLCSKDRTSNE